MRTRSISNLKKKNCNKTTIKGKFLEYYKIRGKKVELLFWGENDQLIVSGGNLNMPQSIYNRAQIQTRPIVYFMKLRDDFINLKSLFLSILKYLWGWGLDNLNFLVSNSPPWGQELESNSPSWGKNLQSNFLVH